MTEKAGMKKKDGTSAVKKLTLEQKASLCAGKNFWYTKNIDEQGIPSIMVADGPHGLRKQEANVDQLGISTSVPAVCFPTAVTLASSWDRDLLHAVGTALGEECRAQRVSVLLGPGVNIKRSPLCGRNFEYYSEDPFLAGELAAAFINGVQSQGVGTSLKHYAVNNQEYHRLVSDSVVDERTLREIYLAAFEIAVKKAKPWTVMAAYNRVNGDYCCEHRRLLAGILRDEWGFDGVVVSDWGAVNDRVRGVEAGLDLEMPCSGSAHDKMIADAVRNGSLKEEYLDAAVTRLLALVGKSRPRLNETFAFDEEAHHRLARRAAAESAVLLKNDGPLLPLGKNLRLAVIGDLAVNPRYQGNGSSLVNPTRLDNTLEEIKKTVGGEGTVTYARGYDAGRETADPSLEDEALAAAKAVDAVVIFAGLPPAFESEGFDREHLNLPDNQVTLIEKIAAVNEHTAVLLSNGSPVSMPWLGKVRAVLEAYLGGQAGGGGAADVLFGAVNPAGRLAETFPLKLEDTACHHYFPGEPRQVQYREGLYVGYRYFDTVGKEVLFPFGYGLSYTDFAYSGIKLSKSEIDADEPLTVSVTVKNTGSAAGHEVAQLYVHDTESAVYRPAHELKGFEKVFLGPGESREVAFTLDRRAFAFYDVHSRDWQVEPGSFEIRVGSSSRDIRLRAQCAVRSSYRPNAERADPMEYRRPAAGEFTVSDDSFAALLGRPLEPAEPVRPFHINSTLGEVKDTAIGGLVYRQALKEAIKNSGEDLDESSMRMVDAMVREMPLRGIVLFSGGKFGYALVEGVIHMLNGKYGRGLLRMLELVKK